MALKNPTPGSHRPGATVLTALATGGLVLLAPAAARADTGGVLADTGAEGVLFLIGIAAVLVLGGIAAFLVTRKRRKNVEDDAPEAQDPDGPAPL